ncbi:MAG: EamA family transporter [Clostridia bacterium]|nr:EamA family transporter [Clostridia bacterium]
MPTVLCALGYAVVVLLLQSIMIYAMKIGSMSTMSLLNLYGMVIPAIAGPIFWAESFGILQIVGLIAMIVSIFFFKEPSTNDNNAGKLQIFLCIACFLMSGSAGLMEKIHQSTYGRAERSEFLAIAYSTMLLISVIIFFITKKNSQVPLRNKKNFIITGILSGLITGGYSFVNLYLAGNLDTLIYYPVANGGALLLTVFISVLLFHEKPTTKKIIGFVLGLISVVLLCFPTI